MTMNARASDGAFEPTIGAKLHERYELEARIGEGGMGEVWRARDLSLKRQVAIKFLHGAFADKEETRARFLVEAQVTAQLNSRHAVLVYDFGVTDDGKPYFVLELLHGETLAQRIERLGKLDAETTVSILRKAARALTKAHALRIVHRDFKPDNVFLTAGDDGEGEEVKVVDFGIAKMIGSLEERRNSMLPEDLTMESAKNLTRTNAFVGTPQYMAPEQIRQLEVGPPVDVWALGVVAFECLTGVPPFTGEQVIHLFANIQLGRSSSAHQLEPSVPEAFDAWFRRACAGEPEERFADPNQAVAELAAVLLPSSEARAPMRASMETPAYDLSAYAPQNRSSDGGNKSSSGSRTVAEMTTPATFEQADTVRASLVPGLPRTHSRARIAVLLGVLAVGAALALAGITTMRGREAQGPAAAGTPSAVQAPQTPQVTEAKAPETKGAEAKGAIPPPAETASAKAAPEPAAPQETAAAPPPKVSSGNKGRSHGSSSSPSEAPAGSAAAKADAPKERRPEDAPQTPPKAAPSSSSPFTLPPLGL